MPLPAEMARVFTEEKIDFVKRCGLKAEQLEPGFVRLRMPLSGNQNHIGTLYAGALFTLAEIPGGALFLTSDLEAAARRLGDMRLATAYRLIRSRDGEPAHEPFKLFSIRERIAPLGLAVIEHAYPCADADILIGAFAMRAGGLLTRNACHFKTVFPGLRIEAPVLS